MRIAVDLRSLHSGGISGVENYILNLLENLLPLDKRNSYILFYNAWKPVNLANLHFANSRVVFTRIPNKILNLSLRALKYPPFEKLAGDFDCLFLPNFNHFSLGQAKKLIVTVHDLSPLLTPHYYDSRRRLWHRLLNIPRILARADLILAVSEFTKQDLQSRLGIEGRKIKVVYPGIDHGLFHPGLDTGRLRQARNLYGLPGEYLLFVSTVEPRKNLSTVLTAFERLTTKTHLVIAGRRGWKYSDVFHQISRSRKRSFIHYLGYVPEEDKPYIIALAQAVVYPSFYEGFGFVPLEAMSCGVPVVTSQITSLPEVVGQAALTINPYNASDLVFALREVLTNQSLRQDLISRGLEQSRKFSWQTTALQTLEAINSLA